MRSPSFPRAVLLGLLLLAPAGTAAAAEPVRWGRLTLDAPAVVDSAAWREALDLEGRPVEEAPLPTALRRGLRVLARAGYPFAVVHPGDFDLRDGRLVGTLRVDPGDRATVAGLRLSGAKVTRPRTALRVAGLVEGQTYTGEEDAKARERLARSGLFNQVGAVRLAPAESAGAVILEIPVTEPPYTRFQGVLGVSGPDSKLTGLLDLDLANIAGTARSARGRWENRGEGLTRFSLHYREPWLPLVPIGVEGNLDHDVNESLYSFTKWEVTGDISWRNQWTFRAGRGGSKAVETREGGDRETESFFMGGIALDRLNSARNPTAGFQLSLESRRGTKTRTPAGDSLQVRLDRTRWNLAAEAYRRVGARWLGVLRSRFEYLDTPEDSIPRWDLFAVGGATTLRGYREEQFLTPASWVVQSEWRWLQGTEGSAVYLFADAAFLAPPGARRLRDTLNRFLLGTGVGVRQASRLGILGVEYGVAKGESPLQGRIHLRIDAVF